VLHPDALTVLKGLQPPDRDWETSPTFNFLVALNRLAVKDRHVKLPFLAPRLRDFKASFLRADGAVKHGRSDSPALLEDGAEIKPVPKGTVGMKVKGTPVITVQVSGPDTEIKLPDTAQKIVAGCRELVIPELRSYVRPT
jgi:hypothetical protein